MARDKVGWTRQSWTALSPRQPPHQPGILGRAELSFPQEEKVPSDLGVCFSLETPSPTPLSLLLLLCLLTLFKNNGSFQSTTCKNKKSDEEGPQARARGGGSGQADLFYGAKQHKQLMQIDLKIAGAEFKGGGEQGAAGRWKVWGL